MPEISEFRCSKCGKLLPSVHEKKQGAQGLLCYDHFLQTSTGRQLLTEEYKPPVPIDTGAGGPGRFIDQIHFHHSASESGNAASFRYYHSVVLGWGDIAYHAVVTNGFGGPDGEIQLGKDESLPGYSVGIQDLNNRCLAICYVGNFSPGRYPTPKQWKSGVAKMHEWATVYGVFQHNVRGHRFWNPNSSCPGFEDAVAVQMAADVFAIPKPIQEADVAIPVQGLILEFINTFEGPRLPMAKEYPVYDNKRVHIGWVQHFSNGIVFADRLEPGQPRYHVHGAILAKFLSGKGVQDAINVYGKPMSNELIPASDPNARYTVFSNARIYWSTVTGAIEVHGAILEKYLEVGGPAKLGLPTLDEYDYHGDRRSDFQRGYIQWDKKDGARVNP